jgi:hypothetical protein
MTPNDDLTTTQGAAVVALLLLLLVPLAVALAVWFKHRYAKAVVQLQASTAASAKDAAAQFSQVAPDTEKAQGMPLLRQTVCHADAVPAAQADDPTRPARRLRAKVLAVQFFSGLLYWWMLLLVFAIGLTYLAQVTGQNTSAGEMPDWVFHLVVWPLLVLPAALAWAFQAGVREARVWTVSALTMGLLGVGLAMGGIGWLASGGFVVVCALLAFMLAAFMRPAVRGAGPPLVAAFTVGFLVFSVLVWLATLLDSSTDDALTASDWVWGGLALTGMTAVASYASWRMLMRLARRYNDKCFSELQLALGAYWALITSFTLAVVLFLSFEQRTGASMEWLGLGILVCWWLWRWLQRGALWLVLRRRPEPLGALLLLRVFKPSDRSEAFTDRFLAHWRFAAPVWMIAGPDLAGAYMEPDEFFAYLRRRLHERFITDPTGLADRLATMDNERDPDGRFRVNELFCANSTWQPTVQALIDKAGVVLLDMREYTSQRAGTRFELAELLRRVPLHKVLVVVGAKDDATLIQREIEAIWQQVGGAASGVAPALQLISLGEGSDAEIRGLFRAAARAATSAAQRSAESPDAS